MLFPVVLKIKIEPNSQKPKQKAENSWTPRLNYNQTPSNESSARNKYW